MQQRSIDGTRVAILVTDGFEQVEMTEPRKALDGAGARTMLLAPKAGEVRGMNHDEKADSFSVDLQISSANPDDFDAVLLPGGVMNADTLRMVPEAQHFVRRIDASDRPIAVICHAPWLVVSAGLVSGRTITSYYTLQDDIRNAGGRWLDIESCTDRNWTSSRSPSDLPAFNRAMIELFAQYRAAGRKAA